MTPLELPTSSPPNVFQRNPVPTAIGGTALATLATVLGIQRLLKNREEDQMNLPDEHPANKIAALAYQDACALMKLAAGPGLLARGLDLARRAAPTIQSAAQKGIGLMKKNPNTAIMLGGTAMGAAQGVANRQEGQGVLGSAARGAARGAAVTGVGLGALRGAQRLPGMLGPRANAPGLVSAGAGI